MAPEAQQETGWELVNDSSCRAADGGLGPATDETERRRKIRDFAAEHRLDLATAYAVLAGLETLEEALDRTPGSVRPTRRSGPGSPPGGGPKGRPGDGAVAAVDPRLPYDRAFQVAIDSGYLSVQEAIERGNRDSYAEHLSRRHYLPMELALHVADNRVRLHEAVMATFADEETAPGVASVQPGRGKGLVFFLGVLMTAALALHGWQNWVSHVDRDREAFRRMHSAPAPSPVAEAEPVARPEPVPLASAYYKRDEYGRIVRVVGGTPASALVEFCIGLAAQRDGLEALGVVPTDPPYPGTRLGIIRDTRDGALYSVPIRKDDRVRSWTMGDGASPIAAMPYTGRLDLPEPGAGAASPMHTRHPD
jgi:hypothetical protein